MSIRNKGIWTWGHVIYDYHAFFKNMAALGLNRIVIWNDIRPLNAKAVFEEAHRYGIKLIWGFSWGWTDKCGENTKDIGTARINALKAEILKEFDNYRDICADGIYFQSFTETDSEEVNGINIAEAAVELVNSTAAEIFEIFPDIELEFGLHATSVKHSLEKIAKTDKRIRIVWEDCGAFPFDYDSHCIAGFDETREFIRKILFLRGKDEKCGFVFKGMTKLDWSSFEYHTRAYEIGNFSEEFIEARAKEKEPLWEYVTDGWIKNIAYAEEMLRIVSQNKNTTVDELIEDGMFEYEIKQPPVMFAKAADK